MVVDCPPPYPQDGWASGRVRDVLQSQGSREPEANTDLNHVASELRKRGRYGVVEACFLELAEPDIAGGGARCVAHGRNIPFLPVLEMLRGYFGVTGDDSEEAAQRKIAGTLLLLDPALTEMVPLMLDFLGDADAAARVTKAVEDPSSYSGTTTEIGDAIAARV